MDKYLYLFGCLYLFLFWIIIYIFRKDFRRILIRFGFLGVIATFASQWLYDRDYWRPLSVFPFWKIFHIEDFLFSFVFAGVAATIYKFVFRKKWGIKKYPYRRKMFYSFFPISMAILIILNMFFGFNSVITNAVLSICFLLFMVCLRHDLVVPMLATSLLMLIIITPAYYILFSVISPHYWDKYWLLHGTSLGVLVLGGIPWTELFWHASLGPLFGIGHEFSRGKEIC
jgi:hypothetical protein